MQSVPGLGWSPLRSGVDAAVSAAQPPTQGAALPPKLELGTAQPVDVVVNLFRAGSAPPPVTSNSCVTSSRTVEESGSPQSQLPTTIALSCSAFSLRWAQVDGSQQVPAYRGDLHWLPRPFLPCPRQGAGVGLKGPARFGTYGLLLRVPPASGARQGAGSPPSPGLLLTHAHLQPVGLAASCKDSAI